ncbi:MAG: acyltransferase [Rhodospirillaceae bacterium]
MKKEHIEGLDHVRAVMSVCVVCWHVRVIGVSDIFNINAYQTHHFDIIDFFNFHVFLLSVPAFLLVSNYLFAIGGAGATLLWRRISRILLLLTFWTFAYLTVFNGFGGAVKMLQSSDRSMLVLILRAGFTIYYFFVSLIICYVATYAVAKASRIIQLVLLVLSVLFLEAAPHIAAATGVLGICSYWNPTNFVPYAVAAVVVASHREFIGGHRLKVLMASLALAVVLAAWEWHYSIGQVIFLAEKQGLPSYTRGSLVFGAIAVLVLATDPRLRSGRMVKFMSAYSLALYCIHPFFVSGVKGGLDRVLGQGAISTALAVPVIILASYVTVVVLRLYLRREILE